MTNESTYPRAFDRLLQSRKSMLENPGPESIRLLAERAGLNRQAAAIVRTYEEQRNFLRKRAA